MGLPLGRKSVGLGHMAQSVAADTTVTLSAVFIVTLHTLVMISFDVSVTSYLHPWLFNPRKNKALGSGPLDFVLFCSNQKSKIDS